MDRNAYRDDNRTDQPTHPDEPETYSEPDTYWRRRAVTLAAGLGVLGLLAWTLSGGGGKPGGKPGGTAAQNSSATGTLSAPASPGVSASAQASAPTAGGDAAVATFTRRFDTAGSAPPPVEVTRAELTAAIAGLDPAVRAGLELSIENVQSGRGGPARIAAQ